MPRTILIVDDHESCAEPLQLALESMRDVQVRIVGNAPAAMAALKDNVSAVITDLHMPNVTGLELLESIKSDAVLSKLPVVVISGDSDPGLPARVLRCGASAFFLKPYSPLEVKRRMEQLLS